MGNVHPTGHNPEDPNDIEHQITATREDFKEREFNPEYTKQRWSLDTHIRNIERIGEGQVTFTPETPAETTITYSLPDLEKYSSVLIKVFKFDQDQSEWNLSNDFSQSIDMELKCLNADATETYEYDDILTVNGHGVVKLTSCWIYQVKLTVTKSNQSGLYAFRVYGERSYDMDANITNIKESTPLPTECVASITADAIIEATADYPLELIWFSETNRSLQ